LTIVSEERQWLAQVLTKQLVREEDRGIRFKDQLLQLEKSQLGNGATVADARRLPAPIQPRMIHQM